MSCWRVQVGGLQRSRREEPHDNALVFIRNGRKPLGSPHIRRRAEPSKWQPRCSSPMTRRTLRRAHEAKVHRRCVTEAAIPGERGSNDPYLEKKKPAHQSDIYSANIPHSLFGYFFGLDGCSLSSMCRVGCNWTTEPFHVIIKHRFD